MNAAPIYAALVTASVVVGVWVLSARREFVDWRRTERLKAYGDLLDVTGGSDPTLFRSVQRLTAATTRITLLGPEDVEGAALNVLSAYKEVHEAATTPLVPQTLTDGAQTTLASAELLFMKTAQRAVGYRILR